MCVEVVLTAEVSEFLVVPNWYAHTGAMVRHFKTEPKVKYDPVYRAYEFYYITRNTPFIDKYR